MFKYLFVLFLSFSSLIYADEYTYIKGTNLHVITNEQEGYFSIEGVYYQYDPNKLPFPIRLGDVFETSGHIVTKLPKGAEYRTITLTSPLNGKKKYSFQSIILNNAPTSQIIKLTEKSRTSEKTTLRRSYLRDDWGVSSTDVPIWVIYTSYDAILDDGTTYEVNIKVRTYHEEKVPELFAREWILPGDLINWGQESSPTGELGNSDVKCHTFFFSDITRNGREIDFNGHFSFPPDTIEIIGFKRHMDQTDYQFHSIARGDPIRLDAFGRGETFKVSFGGHSVWGSAPIYPNTPFIYCGYKYKGNKRVYIFNTPWDLLAPLNPFYLTPIDKS